MSIDQPTHSRSHAFPCWLLCLLVLLTGCGGTSPTGNTKATTNVEREDALAAVRETFGKGADVEACRGAVQQLNDHLNTHPDDKPPSLTDAERQVLANRFGLEPEELAEVSSATFTLLDAHHLQARLLARDIAAVLQVDGLPPPERAHAAFKWVVRQVRLRDKRRILLPMEVVLRRGWGSALERATVFLALLDQLGLEGCLLAVPGPEKDQGAMLWLAGALVDTDLYLFDPRMGLALPAADGKGVATLAQLCAKPELVQALNFEEKLPYDVTPERAKAAEIYLACPLSSLAPRLRWLQSRLALPHRLSLGTDPVATLQKMESLGKGSAAASVKVWNPPGETETPVRVLRSFLPPEEGGIDKTHRREAWMMEVMPLNLMPRRLLELPGEPGNRMRTIFGGLFVSLITDPKMPRELLLRGQYDEATTKLVQLRTELRRTKEVAASQGNLEEQLRPWCERAIAAYGNLIRAEQELATTPGGTAGGAAAVAAARSEVAALWKESQRLQLLIHGIAADPLVGEITYLLALCKHEQAKRAQTALARLQAAGQSGTEREARAAEDAWRAAGEWWDTCLEDAPAGPHAPAARLWRAHTYQALGQREAAVKLLQDLSGDMTDLEKVARLYQARPLKPPPLPSPKGGGG